MDPTYLDLLAEQFPSIQAASTEVVKLEALLNLPKETEHFLSDIHGEHEAFLHLLRSSSGSLRRRIDEIFRDELSRPGRNALTTLIYYPEQKLPLLLDTVEDETDWYRITLRRLLRTARAMSAKYPRSQVLKSLTGPYGSTIEELLQPQEQNRDRRHYYESLIESIISVGQGRIFVIELAYFIQRFAISHLHIVGDVYDRGPGAHIILDELMKFHSVDIQWGNHDIVWMGAAAGSDACIANVVRLSLRYGNTETLENGYGISLLPLASLAMALYQDDPCEQFRPRDADDRVDDGAVVDDSEQALISRMQKAITVIQFKLEGQVVQRRPHYNMNDRLLLDKIDLEAGTVMIDGKAYEMIDTHFPTLDPDDPYTLSERELQLIHRLRHSFKNSQKLQAHARLLYTNGSMYLAHNGHLLYHGCVSLEPDGSFTELVIDDKVYSGKSYMDRVDQLARQGYFSAEYEQRQYGQDAMWYLWSGARSPLFGKSKMATFERYFVADKSTHAEHPNPYYEFRDNEAVMSSILEEFGLDPENSRIINGHVPVRVKKGQRPILANGKLLVIDGGLAKAYQDVTGIAGYTLIANSYGILLAEHKPFVSAEVAIREEVDVESTTESISTYPRRQQVRDTDRGRRTEQRIAALLELLDAYRTGRIKESKLSTK